MKLNIYLFTKTKYIYNNKINCLCNSHSLKIGLLFFDQTTQLAIKEPNTRQDQTTQLAIKEPNTRQVKIKMSLIEFHLKNEIQTHAQTSN